MGRAGGGGTSATSSLYHGVSRVNVLGPTFVQLQQELAGTEGPMLGESRAVQQGAAECCIHSAVQRGLAVGT